MASLPKRKQAQKLAMLSGSILSVMMSKTTCGVIMFFKSKKPADDRRVANGTDTAPHSAIAVPQGATTSPAAQMPGLAAASTEKRRPIARSRSDAFAQIVMLLARSPQHKRLPLADLEWLVIPALTTGQFALAQARVKDGADQRLPAAAVLWANVSEDVDRRLSESPSAPMRLLPQEWNSGDILWLVEAVGNARVANGLFKQLSETVFKGRDAKMRVRDKDGKASIQTLRPLQTPAKPPIT